MSKKSLRVEGNISAPKLVASPPSANVALITLPADCCLRLSPDVELMGSIRDK